MLFNYSVLKPTTDIPAAVDTFAKDTVEAAAKLRQMGVQKVVLVGGSVGGLSALRARLDANAGADGIVCPSGSGSTEITESVAGLQVPVLFVAARDDLPAFEMADELYGATTSTPSRSSSLSRARCTPTCCYSPAHQRSHRWRRRFWPSSKAL